MASKELLEDRAIERQPSRDDETTCKRQNDTHGTNHVTDGETMCNLATKKLPGLKGHTLGLHARSATNTWDEKKSNQIMEER